MSGWISWMEELLRLGGYQLTRWLSGVHPRILMYHRILPAQSGRADITPELFRWQLSILAKHFNVQPLEKLIEDHRKGCLSPYSVALTFDDGYSDFNTTVLPELSAFGFPATLFVTTGFIDGEIWMWPDMLKWALKQTQRKLWTAPDGRRFVLAEQGVQAWHAAADHVMKLGHDEKMGFISEFCQSLGEAVPATPTPEFSPLSWQELRNMPPDLISIGSHTVTHPILSRLDLQSAAHELTYSKTRIQEQLNRDVNGFCYPYGMPAHVSPAVFDAVAKAGYRYACVAYPGRQPFKDRMAINRYSTASDHDGFLKVLFGVRYFRL